ncbi:MutS family DNA mismatch repair protein [Dysgonomonas sp. 25]|uniref:MutS family DNA mismatch repair protein n=1 Tax=Dysgonomonas sp. 25 TaxID=2302933 RepID=UPI0013D157C5|nr:MutS family DNA mismatch repair protein [Dysgonomonas sp. 25]NDV68019.1 hypothetical protein [Dysgonomonas sp. 25]
MTTIEEVKTSYNHTIEEGDRNLSKVKRQIFHIGTIRLLIVLAAGFTCYWLWPDFSMIGLSIIAALVIYLVFAKYHARLFARKQYIEQLIQDARNELSALGYDFSPFDGAKECTDAGHSFSLDLDIFGERSFFQSINRTVTAFGKKGLVDMLLHPLQDKNRITGRQEAIAELSRKQEFIRHFRATGQVGDAQDFDYNALTKNIQAAKSGWWKIVPVFFLLLAVAVFALSFLNVIPAGVFPVYWFVMIIASILLARNIRHKLDFLDKRYEVIRTYSTLLKIMESEQFDSPLLKQIQEKIVTPQSASLAFAQLKKLGNNMDIAETAVGAMLLNPFLGWNVYYSNKILGWIVRHQQYIKTWFEAVGELDSLLSLAMFAYNHPDYVYPEVSDKREIVGKDLGHPMMNREKCVHNDICEPKFPYFMVVTGANMAGKSTYLRTVGVNLVLAGMGAPVCASSFRFYPFVLVTNLRTSDSLNDNESYFFAELKRLKMIIDRLEAGEELFIILDEILKGTNSEDKQRGSIALMKQLVSLGGNGIIATHDLELGNLEQEFPDAVKNYRFEADIEGDTLSFSYKLKEGVAQNMNACFLMKKMGITGL